MLPKPQLLRSTPEERLQTRAVSTGPTDTYTNEAEVVEPVFAMGDGAFLGIDRPVVDSGEAVYPVLTSRPTVGGPHSDSTDVAETTGAFDGAALSPERIQASFFWRRVDAARFKGMDASLRMALSESLREKLDYEAIRGTGGLLTGTVLANHDQAAGTTFAQYLSQFCYGRIDGRYAMEMADIRILTGAATYADMGVTYRAAEADDNALDKLAAMGGGVKVSAHVPAVSGNKQESVIRLGMRRDMVQPMWRGVAIIVDEVTRSGQGEIEVTAVMLMNTKVLRAAGFYKQEANHS